jgi:ferredoxin
MKIRVDPDKCQGHARCFGLAPELFAVDDYGQASVIVDEVPPGWRTKPSSPSRIAPSTPSSESPTRAWPTLNQARVSQQRGLVGMLATFGVLIRAKAATAAVASTMALKPNAVV